MDDEHLPLVPGPLCMHERVAVVAGRLVVPTLTERRVGHQHPGVGETQIIV